LGNLGALTRKLNDLTSKGFDSKQSSGYKEYQDIILDVETKKEEYAGSFYRREKPVKWSSLAHLLQRITSSSKPSLLTFASRME
jgi:hypothetical protein